MLGAVNHDVVSHDHLVALVEEADLARIEHMPQSEDAAPDSGLEGGWTRVPVSISLPFRPTERHAADMVAAIDWTLIVQAAAAAFTAIAAGAAWRAARASRDAVRDQQIAALIGDLNDLHESLTTLGRVLANTGPNSGAT